MWLRDKGGQWVYIHSTSLNQGVFSATNYMRRRDSSALLSAIYDSAYPTYIGSAAIGLCIWSNGSETSKMLPWTVYRYDK
jgi:hypothetical protein